MSRPRCSPIRRQAALGGEEREVTVLFADLQGFTAFSERREPTEVVQMLNHYFGLAVPMLLAEGGTVTHFIGDALMVLFNAPIRQPDHARAAARAAHRGLRAIDAVAAEHPGLAADPRRHQHRRRAHRQHRR